MKTIIYNPGQEKKPVIKNRGLASLATSLMTNDTKVKNVGNRYVWPNSAGTNSKDSYSTKKMWNL